MSKTTTTMHSVGNSATARKWMLRGREDGLEGVGAVGIHLLDSHRGNLMSIRNSAQILVETFDIVEEYDKARTYREIRDDATGLMRVQEQLEDENDGKTEFTESDIIDAMIARTYRDDETGLSHWTRIGDSFITNEEFEMETEEALDYVRGLLGL